MPPHCDSLDGPVVGRGQASHRSGSSGSRPAAPSCRPTTRPSVPPSRWRRWPWSRQSPEVAAFADAGSSRPSCGFTAPVRAPRAPGSSPPGLDVGPVIPVARQALETGSPSNRPRAPGRDRRRDQAPARACPTSRTDVEPRVPPGREYVEAMLGLQVWSRKLYAAAALATRASTITMADGPVPRTMSDFPAGTRPRRWARGTCPAARRAALPRRLRHQGRRVPDDRRDGAVREAMHTVGDIFVSGFLLVALIGRARNPTDTCSAGRAQAAVRSWRRHSASPSPPCGSTRRPSPPASSEEASTGNVGVAFTDLGISMVLAAFPMISLIRNPRGPAAKAQMWGLVSDQLGLVAAVAGTSLALAGFVRADPLAAVSIATIISWKAISLLPRNLSLLIGRSAGPGRPRDGPADPPRPPGVIGFPDLTRALGPMPSISAAHRRHPRQPIEDADAIAEAVRVAIYDARRRLLRHPRRPTPTRPLATSA